MIDRYKLARVGTRLNLRVKASAFLEDFTLNILLDYLL